jgi:calcium-dependent protein kinase
MGCLPLFKPKPPDEQNENKVYDTMKDSPSVINDKEKNEKNSRQEEFSIFEPQQTVSKLDDLIIHASSLSVHESHMDPFDIYEFIKVIGEGSYGRVSKVIHRKLNIVRALKAIEKKNKKGEITEENTNNLRSEINILKSLDHPNIIKIYEYFDIGNKIYITYEYCAGGELFSKLEKIKNFKEKNIANIMKQIISAVNCLHCNGIIHRDLKPENIMIDGDFNNDVENFDVKLIDFGTSQIFRNRSRTLTKRFSEKIGSSYYMAPEVILGNYNEKCDCWSLGVIMYMLISGFPPFNGNNDEEIFNSISTKELKFPSKYFEKISNDAIDLLTNLLCRDVEKRITAQEALDHKWFNNFSKEDNDIGKINMDILKKIFANLKKNNNEMKFQQACISYIIHNMLKTDDIKEYRKIFMQFDTDSDGKLAKEELIKGFSKITSKEDAEEQINNIFENLDKNKNNFIEFEEFLSAFMDRDKLLKEDNLMETFMHFDKDGNGKITMNGLKLIMTGNCDVKDEVWEELISYVDLNSDGEISYTEFKKIMRKMI